MIKIAILGVRGRMGQEILKLARNRLVLGGQFEYVGGVESSERVAKEASLADLAEVPRDKLLTHDINKAIDPADVVIDFTTPDATLENAPKIARAGKAYVVGTTGLAGEKNNSFVTAVKGIPCVFSSNMSSSANVMFDLAERTAKVLSDYDNEIVEIHHNLKKDSPSGTAQTLAESVQRGKGGGSFVYGRKGLVGERKKGEIGVHAVRGGDVVGDHTVLFLGSGERIELVHRVTDRSAFAAGALRAAGWLFKNKKPAGLYDMRDVLGLK